MSKYLLYLFLGLFLWACAPKKQDKQTNPEIPVVVQSLKVQSGAKLLKYSGSIIPYKAVNVSFLVSGQLNQVAVKEGFYVKEGQLLASLDPTDYQFAVDAARAQFEHAQSEYERLKVLYAKGSLTQSDFDKIKALYKEAKADLAYKEKQFSDTRLHAPAEGWISFDKLEPGEAVKMGIPVFRIIHSKNVYAKFMVPENEIGKIQEDAHISLSIPSLKDSVFHGRIERISPKAESFSRSFTVKAIIDNENFIIKPGMIAEIEIQLNTRQEEILVPAESIVKNAHGETFVFVVKDDKVVKKKIRTGAPIGNHIRVMSGLSPGLKVVVEGQHKLYENARIKIIQGS